MTYQKGVVFGVDIIGDFKLWIHSVFAPKFHEQHPGKEFAGYIVEPGASFNPKSTSLNETLVFSTTSNNDVYMGLLQNVRHKHQYSNRTGLDSSTAGDNLHLVLPGDFAYDGFLCHRGIPAGGSGVRKEFDVVYVREIVDKYIELRGAVVREVISLVEWARANWQGDIGNWKYLDGDLRLLDIWRHERAQVALASDSFLAG